MKTLKSLFAVVLVLALFLNMSSCVVHVRHDNGKKKGWYKNPKNPHNPNHNSSGKPKGKHK